MPDENKKQKTLAERQKQEYYKNFIKNLVFRTQEGFILARKNTLNLQLVYRKPKIKLHCLNRKRYLNAFNLPFEFYKGINPAKVNSIMRPTLPHFPFWYIKSAE